MNLRDIDSLSSYGWWLAKYNVKSQPYTYPYDAKIYELAQPGGWIELDRTKDIPKCLARYQTDDLISILPPDVYSWI